MCTWQPEVGVLRAAEQYQHIKNTETEARQRYESNKISPWGNMYSLPRGKRKMCHMSVQYGIKAKLEARYLSSRGGEAEKSSRPM